MVVKHSVNFPTFEATPNRNTNKCCSTYYLWQLIKQKRNFAVYNISGCKA